MSLNADAVDAFIFDEIQKKLEEFRTLSKENREGNNLQVVKFKTRIGVIEDEISSLLSKISTANDSVMQYINNRIAELDNEKKELCSEISKFSDKNRDNMLKRTVRFMSFLKNSALT